MQKDTNNNIGLDLEILGIDIGSKEIKTSNRVRIDNKISLSDKMLDGSVKVKFDGKDYVIGEGEFQTAVNKIDREHMLVSLYTAIAMSTDKEFVSVVVGLPISHYKAFKDELKEKISKNNFQELEYNGTIRRILITDVEVAPEGAVAFKSLSPKILDVIGREDVIVIDVGGRTTDICLYSLVKGKRQIVKYQTVMVGTLNIYDEIAQAVNEKYGLDKTLEDGEWILNNGLSIYGKKQDLSFIKPTLKKQTDKIFKELNMNFPIQTAQSLLIGGGSLLLQSLFKKNLPHVIVANEPIFGNAYGMKKVGEELWLQKDN